MDELLLITCCSACLRDTAVKCVTLSGEESRVIRVLVVDDETLVRAGLRLILQPAEDIDVVSEASDGRQAVDAVCDTGPMSCCWTYGCRCWTGWRLPLRSARGPIPLVS